MGEVCLSLPPNAEQSNSQSLYINTIRLLSKRDYEETKSTIVKDEITC